MSTKMADYEIIEQIRRGNVSASFLVRNRFDGKSYVLKKICVDKQAEKFKRIAVQDMNLLVKLSSAYIAKYKDGWFEKDSYLCVVVSFYEGGDMAQTIKKAEETNIPEERICKWLTQLLLAVDYLHSNRVIHRHLKCSNIFITEDDDIKLADFGLAKLQNTNDLTLTVVDSSANYICPELLMDLPYGYKSDIWSLGCCIFEIAAHRELHLKLRKQLIRSMLRKNPEHRPTAAELLRHQHLEPYVVKYCQTQSRAILPIKSKHISRRNEPKGSIRQNKPTYGMEKNTDGNSGVIPSKEGKNIQTARAGMQVTCNIQESGNRRYRAEGLESLLEICAGLLNHDQFEELEGVLRPFGQDQEAISSRETAIWLTQGLMKLHKNDTT